MSGMLIPGAGVPGAAQGADLSGDAGWGYDVPPGDTLSVHRVISSFTAPEDTLDVRRIIGKLTPPEDTLNIHREVYWRSITPPEDTLSVQRKIITYTPPGDTLKVRRAVIDQEQAPHQRWRVYLNDADITAATSLDINISASEGQNKTATFRFLPALGPLDIPGLQGSDVVITHLTNGVVKELFTGSIDRPVYDYESRRMVCNCSDLKDERLGNESQTLLRQLTGGVFSPIVQQEDAEGRDWVREMMKTVPGSLNYDGAGVLFYAPWTLQTPRYTLQNHQVRRDELSFSFAERSQIVNRVKIKVDYRYNRQRVRSQAVTADAGYDNLQETVDEQVLTTREAYLDALQNLSNWSLLDYELIDFEDLSWGSGIYYRNFTRVTTYEDGERRTVNNPINAVYATGVNATIARHISQPVTETYSLTLEAPESIDQFGVVEGSAQQHAVETDIEGDAFEEQEPSSAQPAGFSLSAAGDYIRYADDKRDDLELAMNAARLVGEKEILAAHRKNTVTYINHNEPMDGILDIRIGDGVELDTQVVECSGNVKSYDHRQDREGMSDTRLTLALSYVSSAVTTSNNWALPAAPSIPEQPRNAPAEIQGTVDNGIVEIEAPEIAEVYVDEVEAKRTASYTLQIPRDPIIVNRTDFHE